MKVSDLIAKLQELDGNRLVVLSSDAEGNHYGSLYRIWTAKYDPRYHEIGLEALTEPDRQAGYTEEDVMESGVPAVVLCP